MNVRLPLDATPEQAELAGEAFETLVRVMRGEVSPELAPHRRNAAKDIREEICKPIAKQVNLADADGEKLTVAVTINLGDE